MDKNSIIFDGACGFCNKIILFFAKKDKNNHYLFVSSQSELGSLFLLNNKLTEISKISIIVFENNKIYINGSAIKMIFKNIHINFLFNFIVKNSNVILINFVYKFISNNRLILTNNVCKVPPKNIKSKFIL